jgi:RimJ/RimL family protein N-acetyltransferase
MGKLETFETKIKDGSTISLRNGTPEDSSNYLEYVKKVIETSPYVITEPDEFESDLEKQKSWIKTYNESDSSILIAAIKDGKIIGNIDFNSRSSRRRIAHRGSFGMGVSQEFRNKGVGKVLLSSLIEWCKKDDNPIEKIDLGVLSENKPGIALYKSFGFKQEGFVEKAVKVGDKYIDQIQMCLWVK